MDAHLQIALFEMAAVPGAAPVWETLDEGQRAEALTALAQMIAKAASEMLGLPRMHEEQRCRD